MLQELYISNFVLIDKVTITLCERLNVFSGATGVGKSMIIGALNFIIGGRATADLVRSGKEEATVIGKFSITDGSLLMQIKKISDNNTIEEELLLQRSIDTNGRSRCRLNDFPITVSMLKEIGEILINIHGQHEHETLLHGINQLYILDDFGGISPLREQFADIYQQFTEKTILRDTLKSNQLERGQKRDLYAFQIDEIDKAQLKASEAEELEKEKTLLSNAEKIYSTISSCYSQLYEASDAILERLKSVRRELQSIAKLDDTLQKIFDDSTQSAYLMEDMAFLWEIPGRIQLRPAKA